MANVKKVSSPKKGKVAGKSTPKKVASKTKTVAKKVEKDLTISEKKVEVKEEKVLVLDKPIQKDKKTKTKKKEKKEKISKKTYGEEVKAELKKVKWPTKEEMIKYSTAVLIFIVIFGLYFYAFDALFAWITSLVKGL